MPNGTLKRGDWVEVLPPTAILATLDPRGMLDDLPFMPEMAQTQRAAPVLPARHPALLARVLARARRTAARRRELRLFDSASVMSFIC